MATRSLRWRRRSDRCSSLRNKNHVKGKDPQAAYAIKTNAELKTKLARGKLLTKFAKVAGKVDSRAVADRLRAGRIGVDAFAVDAWIVLEALVNV